VSLRAKYGKVQKSPELGPVVKMRVYLPDAPEHGVETDAVVDTGASRTTLPESVITELELGGKRVPKAGKVNNELADGRVLENQPTYWVAVRIGDCEWGTVRVAVKPRRYAMIGRDIMRDCTVYLHGPDQHWRAKRIRKRPCCHSSRRVSNAPESR